MKLGFMSVLLGSTLITTAVAAGIPEGIKYFDDGLYDKALAEFTYLSEEGDPTAFYYLGRMYNEGLGVDKNTEKAVHYFRQADGARNAAAATQLGKMMLSGEGMSQNPELGLQFLKKAAYAGNGDALYELGNAYAQGNGVEKNLTYAFGFYLISALQGDQRAQYEVGKAYLEGVGVPQDYENAVKWYSRAANQGYVKAQLEWAEIRETNMRLKNLGDAYSWYAILAAYNSNEIGQQAAQKRDELNATFQKVEELMARQKALREWRPTSAADSVPQAERQSTVLPVIPGFNDPETTQSMLSAGTVLLTDGTPFGVSTDMIELAVSTGDKAEIEAAVTKSVEAGKVRAYTFYGDLLHARFEDEAGALSWYQKGADAGDEYAQYQLAKMYCEGRGMENPDAVTCYGWLLSAAQKQDSPIAQMIQNATDTVKEQMTEEELNQGKALADARQAPQVKKTDEQPGLFKLF